MRRLRRRPSPTTSAFSFAKLASGMEDVAVTREEPVDGPVVALDVRVRPGERVRGQPVGVHREGREERQRPRRRVRAPLARRRRATTASSSSVRSGGRRLTAARTFASVARYPAASVGVRSPRSTAAVSPCWTSAAGDGTRGRARGGDGEAADASGDGCGENEAHDDRGASRVAAIGR